MAVGWVYCSSMTRGRRRGRVLYQHSCSKELKLASGFRAWFSIRAPLQVTGPFR